MLETCVVCVLRGELARDGVRFYFFLVPPDGLPNVTFYQHNAIALAEGLTALGIPFTSNIDYWTPEPGGAPLFRADPSVDPTACTAVIFNSDWLWQEKTFPAHLFGRQAGPKTVYLDSADGSRPHSLQPGFPAFDFVLRAHFVRHMPYPRGFRPWAFGLSQRLIEATAPRDPPEPRHRRLLVSYRHTQYTHPVRTHLGRRFMPAVSRGLEVHEFADNFNLEGADGRSQHLWTITGRRHSEAYYRAMRESLACACFGGYFVSPWPRDERKAVSRFLKRVLARTGQATGRITQYDSWRLWESLAAGCATIHLDLERYGAMLPVMPRNWEHYIGLDLRRLDEDIDRILFEPQLLERIAAAGREWVLSTYSPAATAERFLGLFESSLPQQAVHP